MPQYQVRCVDRKTGEPYTALVEAASAQDALVAAARIHIVSTVSPTPVASDPVVAEIRLLCDQVARGQRAFQRNVAVGVFFGIIAVLILPVVLLAALMYLGLITTTAGRLAAAADVSLGDLISATIGIIITAAVAVWSVRVTWRNVSSRMKAAKE